MDKSAKNVDMEELLGHLDFVRRLAQKLVRDEHRAEDAVQETFAVAAASGPRESGTARAWLATVLRNAVRRLARADARRRRRELEAALREPRASASELIERERVRQEVVAAVLALEEPFRTAVIHRWFDRMPPREIARRTGVPVNTVRSRLRLANERLRRRLDDVHGGDRKSWALPLLLLARGRAPAAGAGALAATVAGALTMTKTKIAVLAAVLLLIAAAAWQLAPVDPKPPAGPSDGAAGMAPGATTVANAADESEAPDTLAGSAAKAAPATVIVEVRDSATGDVGAGAAVTLVAPDGTEHVATADAKGEARFEDVPPGGPYALRATAAGRAVTVLPGYRWDGGETHHVRLRLEVPGALLVRVVGPDGRPVADARVALVPRVRSLGFADRPDAPDSLPAAHVRPTDEAGRARFEPIPAEWWVVRVRKDGYGLVGASFPVPPAPATGEATVALAPACSLSGRVVDADGAPAPDVPVVAAPPEHAPGTEDGSAIRTRTDASGRFRLTDLAPGTWKIRVPARPRPRVERTVRLPGVETLDLVLPRVARAVVTGTVTDAETDRPLAGVAVNVGADRTVTDPDGRYRLECAAGAVRVDFDVEGYAREQSRETLAADSVTERDVALSPGGTITGRVLGPDGPVVGVPVATAPVDMRNGWGRMLGHGTDADGRFTVTGLASGEYAVVVATRDLYTPGAPVALFQAATADPACRVVVAEGQRVEHDVRVAAGLPLHGVVVDEDGKPVAGGRVQAASAFAGLLRDERIVTTGTDGRFRLDGLPPGEATLFVRKEGFAPAGRIRVAVAPESPPVRITLYRAPVLRGSVRTEAGEPVAGATVEISGELPSNGRGGFSPAPVRLRTATGPDGAFVGTAPVAAGSVHLVAHSPGRPDAERTIPVATYAREIGADLVVPEGLSIRGRVVDRRDGSGIVGARVCVAGADAAVTGPDGRFAVEGLSVGRKQLQVDAAGFGRPPTAFVDPPTSGDLTIALDPARVIAGVVVREDGTPVAGIRVVADPVDGEPGTPYVHAYDATTAADGTFRIEDLPDGDYRLMATGGKDFVRRTLPRVEAGRTDVRISVEAGGRIAGRIVDEGEEPVPGARISAWPEEGPTDLDRVRYAETGEDGSFRVSGLEDGTYRLDVSPLGRSGEFLFTRKTGVRPGTTDLEIVMPRALAISGRITTEDGRPVTTGRVLAGDRTWAFPDAEGRFTIPSLGAGIHHLAYGTEDAADGLRLLGRTDVAAGTDGVELVATPAEEIAGRVVNAAGEPVAGAGVGARPEEGGGRRIGTKTGADGTFHLRGLPPGTRWRLVAYTEDRRRAEPVVVEAGATDVSLTVR